MQFTPQNIPIQEILHIAIFILKITSQKPLQAEKHNQWARDVEGEN